MKKLLILLPLLLCWYTSRSQFSQTTTVKISMEDCRDTKPSFWISTDTMRFYKLPEDTLTYTIKPRNYTWPVTIQNVPTGSYRLVFKNLYRQSVTETITLSEQDTNTIVLCPDKLSDYPQNTLARLQDKDSIVIRYKSQGCFHWSELKLVIIKENESLVAHLYSASSHFVRKKGKTTEQYIDGPLLKTIVMNSQHIADFTRFENELNYAENSGCTTTDWYDLISQYLTLKKTDGSCQWRGFDYLLQSFFKLPE